MDINELVEAGVNKLAELNFSGFGDLEPYTLLIVRKPSGHKMDCPVCLHNVERGEIVARVIRNVWDGRTPVYHYYHLSCLLAVLVKQFMEVLESANAR